MRTDHKSRTQQISTEMNLSNVAQILAAVGAASEFGGDMPCQNEVLDAAFCIIKTGQGGVNDAGEMSEMGGALSCLMVSSLLCYIVSGTVCNNIISMCLRTYCTVSSR